MSFRASSASSWVFCFNLIFTEGKNIRESESKQYKLNHVNINKKTIKLKII